jgi:hypothetical protein
MIKEDIYCGLIWNTEENKFIAIFTIRDFLNIIILMFDKIKDYLKINGKITNINTLASNLFTSHKFHILHEIIEDNEFSKYSEKSENEDMLIDDDVTYTVETNFNNYKEFFKIFNHISINDYFTNIYPVNINYIRYIGLLL